MNAPVTLRTDHRESSDLYRDELFRRGGFRVIVCKDHIQWIMQGRKNDAGKRDGARWVALGYFATRAALARLWHTKTGEFAPEIDALPERFLRRSDK